MKRPLTEQLEQRTSELEMTTRALEQARHELEILHAVVRTARLEAEIAKSSKTSLIRNVCHELRTPLNAILGFAEIMKLEVTGHCGNSRHQEYGGHILRSGRHLLALLDDLLDLERIKAGRREMTFGTTALHEIAACCCRMLEVSANQSGISLLNDIPTGLSARGDGPAVKQIMLNLIDNAVQYGRQGGSVHVRGERVGEEVNIIVEDDGIGIDESDLGRLGQVFVRAGSETVRQATGSGLGLALSRALALEMNGALSITSRLGKGTCVTLILPADATDWSGGPDTVAS